MYILIKKISLDNYKVSKLTLFYSKASLFLYLSEIILNIGTPTIVTTTNSPIPTCSIVINIGNFDTTLSIHPTISPLNIVGHKDDIIKLTKFDLIYFDVIDIALTLKKVAKVPKVISINPYPPNIFDIRHPKVNPTMYIGSRKARRTKISDILNCIGP